MRLYSGTSAQFVQDNYQNQIAEKLRISFFSHFRYNPSPGEIRSWQNSLRAMSSVIQGANLMDHGVLLEYQLPLTSRRLDCMISGKDESNNDNAVIVELKQWDKCSAANGENEVTTWLAGAQRECLHPSVQVGRYQMYLQDTHTAFYDSPDPISLSACTYLHNYSTSNSDEILSAKFKDALERFPLFTSDDVNKLSSFLSARLINGGGIDVLNRIEKSKYRPSKKLLEHVGSIVKGKREYILLDEQLIVYDKVLSCVQEGFHKKQKNVIIIRGGPGTGKSVVAINLLADLSLKGYNTHYATGSKAFTETLRKIIGTKGSVQFKYFNSYAEAELNSVDVLVCDEAHRLRITSNSRFTPKERRSGLRQIDELLNAAKVVVFFIDDDQIVRPNEIGSVEYLEQLSQEKSCGISKYEL